MDLIAQLGSIHGLSQAQAEGAIGAIGRAAQGRLAPDHFTELGRLVPGLTTLIQREPAGGGGLLGSLGGMLGGKLGDAAAMAGAFKAVGIASGEMTPIARTVLGFVRTHGSPPLQQAVNTLATQLGIS